MARVTKTPLDWMQETLIEIAIKNIREAVQVRIHRLVDEIIDEEMTKTAVSIARLTNVAMDTNEITISIRNPARKLETI